MSKNLKPEGVGDEKEFIFFGVAFTYEINGGAPKDYDMCVCVRLCNIYTQTLVLCLWFKGLFQVLIFSILDLSYHKFTIGLSMNTL